MQGYPRGMWVIQNWSVCSASGRAFKSMPFLPFGPNSAIQGTESSRPGFAAGIVTTQILQVQGRRIRTNNSRYVLGRPDPAYIAECRKQGWPVPSHKHPLKVTPPVVTVKAKPKRDAKGRFAKVA